MLPGYGHVVIPVGLHEIPAIATSPEIVEQLWFLRPLREMRAAPPLETQRSDDSQENEDFTVGGRLEDLRPLGSRPRSRSKTDASADPIGHKDACSAWYWSPVPHRPERNYR